SKRTSSESSSEASTPAVRSGAENRGGSHAIARCASSETAAPDSIARAERVIGGQCSARVVGHRGAGPPGGTGRPWHPSGELRPETLRMRRLGWAGGLALAAVLAACGGDDDGTGGAD